MAKQREVIKSHTQLVKYNHIAQPPSTKKEVFAVNKTNLFIIVPKTNVIKRESLLLMRFKTRGINYEVMNSHSVKGRDVRETEVFITEKRPRKRKGNVKTQLFILGYFRVPRFLSREIVFIL